MFRHHFLAFLLTFAAFVLLVLVTFSPPFISTFYFLDASGVRFGIWGFCNDVSKICSTKALGYESPPEIIPWLTKVLILFPIAAGITLLALISLVPMLCTPNRDRYYYYPHPVYSFFILFAFVSSLVAFAFMIALFVIALNRFHAAGETGTFGPAIWMSLAATVDLLLLTLSSGCGNLCRGRFGRTPPYMAYTY